VKIKSNIYIIFIIFLIGSSNVSAQKFSNAELKAAYIIKFTKFIKWPTNKVSKSNFVLGIYGNDPFENILNNILASSPEENENWLVTHYSKIEEIKGCDILYINTDNQNDINAILKKISHFGILTIGDNIPYFCERGGIINFNNNAAEKYIFQINKMSAINKGFIIDSRLLAIAKLINSPGY